MIIVCLVKNVNNPARAEASRIQGLGIDGEIMSRQAEKGKISTLMGMAADDVSNANQARAEAKSDMYKGIATVGSSLTSMGGVGGGTDGGGGATDIGKTAALPGGGSGDVNSLLSNLDGQGIGNSNPSANTTTGNPHPVNSPQWNRWNQVNGINDPTLGGPMGGE